MRLWYASFMRGREEAWFSLIAIFLASLFLAVSAFLVFASFLCFRALSSGPGCGCEVGCVFVEILFFAAVGGFYFVSVKRFSVKLRLVKHLIW